MKSNTIIHGDCLEVMRTLPDASFKLAVTSPPYNVKPPEQNSVNSLWKSSVLMNGGYDGYNDTMSNDEYSQWQRDVISETLRVLRNDGALFYNHKWIQKGGVFYDRREITDQFPVRCIVIWDRGSNHVMNRTMFAPSYEVIYVIAKPDFRLLRGGITSVWRFNFAKNNPHPAPFPIELPLRCIDSCIERNDEDAVVIDPFMGSGTTAIAAMRHGIRWVGIEQSAEYVRMANERIVREQSQLKFEI